MNSTIDITRWMVPTNAEIVEKAAQLSMDFASRTSVYDRDPQFSLENFQMLQEARLLGLTIPREYGGLEADVPLFLQCLTEVAKGCSSTALTLCMHWVVLSFIAVLETPEQKVRYFGEVIEHGGRFASATSEPQASLRDIFV